MKPRSDLHFDAATRNQTIAYRLVQDFDPEVSPRHDDWIITVLFYSGLHFVDALIVATYEQKPRNHVQRARFVESDSVLSRLAFEYFSLKDLSQTARYQPVHRFSPDLVQQAFDQLEEIRRVVSTELNSR